MTLGGTLTLDILMSLSFSWQSCCRLPQPFCSVVVRASMSDADCHGGLSMHLVSLQMALRMAESGSRGVRSLAELIHTDGDSGAAASSSRRAGSWFGFAALDQLSAALHSELIQTLRSPTWRNASFHESPFTHRTPVAGDP